MSAATTANEGQVRDGKMGDHPVLAAEIVYKGRPVLLVAASGYAFTNDGSTNTLASGDVFAGIAYETVDNSAGSSGDKRVRTITSGVVEMGILGTVTEAKIGDAVYVNNVSDDNDATLTTDTGNQQVQIGVLVGVISTTRGLVRIDNHVYGKSATA